MGSWKVIWLLSIIGQVLGSPSQSGNGLTSTFTELFSKVVRQNQRSYDNLRYLRIDPNIENVNIYTDEEDNVYPDYDHVEEVEGEDDTQDDETTTADPDKIDDADYSDYMGSKKIRIRKDAQDLKDAAKNKAKTLSEICKPILAEIVKKHDQPNLPFPTFLAPLMTLLSDEFDEASWKHRTPNKLKCIVHAVKNLENHPCNHTTSSCVALSVYNGHIFFGCMNSLTGEIVAPKGYNLFENNTDKLIFDFRVPSPFKTPHRNCTIDLLQKPICQRVNIFYREQLILEDTSCCCKGKHCANVLFDQQMNGNPVPFIHIELDESDAIHIATPRPGDGDEENDENPSQGDAESQVHAAGFDWGFSAIETFVIACVIIIVLVIVVAIGLWFMYEKQQAQNKNPATVGKTPALFDEDTEDQQFEVKRAGRSLY